MPEGPEIRRAADRLGKALIGRRIVLVLMSGILFCSLLTRGLLLSDLLTRGLLLSDVLGSGHLPRLILGLVLRGLLIRGVLLAGGLFARFFGNESPKLLSVDRRAVVPVTLQVELAHAALTVVARMILVHIDSLVVHATSETAAAG